MKPRNDEAALFAELAARHGVDAGNLADAALVRALAKELASDEVDPGIVTGLSSLLPARRVPETADLSKLSDDELNKLGTLLAKARGTGFEPLPKRRRSPRVRDALRFVAALDRIAARIAAGTEPFHETPTEFERNELRGHVNVLLVGLNGTAADILGYPPAVMERAPLPPPIEALPPPAQQTPYNVVPIAPGISWEQILLGSGRDETGCLFDASDPSGRSSRGLP